MNQTPRITLPTKSLLQGCTYRRWYDTDIRITWAMWMARRMLERNK